MMLPQPVQDMIRKGELSAGHGRAILMAEGSARRTALARKIAAEGLSVRQAEALCQIKEVPQASRRPVIIWKRWKTRVHIW